MDMACSDRKIIANIAYRRKSIKKYLLAISIVVVMQPLVASAQPQRNQSASRVKVRFVESHRDSLLETLPTYIAEKKHLFDKYGIDVEFMTGSGGGTTMRLLSTDNADVADAGAASAILAARSDPNIELIGAWYHSASAMQWIAPLNSHTMSPRDLSGAKFGYSRAGSTSQFLAEESAKRAGVRNASFVSIGGMGANWTAAKSGIITAGWAMAPFLQAKVKSHQAKVVLKPGKYIRHFYVGAIDVRKDFAEAHPNAIKAVFLGLEDAVQFIKDHPDQAAVIGAKQYNYPKAVIAAGVNEYLKEDFWNFKVDFKAFENVVLGMVKTKHLDQKLDIISVLNQRYLPEHDKNEQ